MATNVFANGREICSKAADGKAVAAFPDACWSPPTPPAGPIPLPYPNTAFAKDLTKGTKKVKICKKEVAMKDKSYFKKSTGNEPATQQFAKGFMTAKLQGKMYFTSWSPNVRAEGKNVTRHQDMTTHNHGSGSNTAPFVFLDHTNNEKVKPCEEEKKAIEEKCKPKKKTKKKKESEKTENEKIIDKLDQVSEDQKEKYGHKPSGENAWMDDHCDGLWVKPAQWTANAKETFDQMGKVVEFEGVSKRNSKQKMLANQMAKMAEPEDCLAARRCMLVPFNKTISGKVGSGIAMKGEGCCPGQTGHHIIPDNTFDDSGCKNYNRNKAPTICVEGIEGESGTHGKIQEEYGKKIIDEYIDKGKTTISYTDASRIGIESIHATFPNSCGKECLQAQLDTYYKECDCPGELPAKSGLKSKPQK